MSGGGGARLPTVHDRDGQRWVDVEMQAHHIGYLMAGIVWPRAKEGDPMARTLYLRLKRAAIALGVEWYYGDPWPEASGARSDDPEGGSEPGGGR